MVGSTQLTACQVNLKRKIQPNVINNVQTLGAFVKMSFKKQPLSRLDHVSVTWTSLTG